MRMSMDYQMLGKRIRLRRKNMNLTQGQLAKQIDRAASFVGHIERGTRKMGLETLCELAIALNCTTDELLGLEMRGVNCDAAARELLEMAQRLALGDGEK